ncbi:heavy metal-associated isoprenylated plant protein 19-like [Chenopodium quinoa]|uniref:heavy metal-associated isoprenylated plant protein 19-like n=1 Tax=Chenopodium quinoa TaxID=63459 RepID=UPI000B79005F|nr:heavy metal-associated isoprenylated plant protein 19-like [Chenopodium quinoa]
MGKHKQGRDHQVVEVHFNISMHCNACEKKVANVVSKIKGVEKFITDMTRNKVIILGRFCPEKVLKKLKKKIGKKVHVIEYEGIDNKDKRGIFSEGETKLGEDNLDYKVSLDKFSMWYDGKYYGNDNPIFTIFSDENANSCAIM